MLYPILICLIVSAANANGPERNATVGEFLKRQIEVVNDVTRELMSHDIITLRDPPVSIVCNKTDTGSIQVIKNSAGLLYLLSEDELLAIEIQSREAHLRFVGTLLHLDGPVLEVQVENWENVIVIVVRTAQSLQVYLTKNDFSVSVSLEAIQKINTYTQSDRFVLFGNGKELLMVTYNIRSDADNELMFYRWKSSFFSHESSEMVQIPNKNDLFIFNEDATEPLVLSIGYGNTTKVVISKLNPEFNRWTKLQSMHFKQDYIKHYVVDKQLFLIGCSSEDFCAVYKWTNDQFRRQHKLNSQVVEKIKSVYSRHDIVVMENFHRQISFYSLDDIATLQPGLERSNSVNVADYALYKTPSDHQLFYVEFIFNKTSLAINIFNIGIHKAHGASDRSELKLKDPIECVAKLKSYLKSRIPVVQASHQHSQKLLSQENKLEMMNKKFLNTSSLNLKNTNVTHIKMAFSLKTPASDLAQRVVNNNIIVERTRFALKNSQMPAIQGRAGEETLEDLENIAVDALTYNGRDPIFSDVVLKSQPTVTLSGNIKLRNLTANKVDVKSNQINRIPFDQMQLVSSSKPFSGTKAFRSLIIGNLTIKQTLNNLSLKFLNEGNAPLELSDGFVFRGNINVRNLNVKTVNGFNISAVMENVFLDGDRNIVRGNLILRNVTNVDKLQVNSIMNVPVENLMTTSTDQVVSTDISITKLFATTVVSNTINDEELSQNIAVVNDVNIIEVPTTFLTIHILENLKITDSGDSDEQRAGISKTIEILKRHVIGTQKADLSQIYNGQVVIQGTLTIKDTKMFSPKSKIIVNDREVPQNISSNFWMKNLRQEIGVDRFTITNQATSSNVITSLLNGHPVRQHMTLDAQTSQGPVNIRFEKAVVTGDVVGHRDNIPSLLFNLNRTAIPRQGPAVFVQSSIDFRENLNVRNLVATTINDRLVKEMIHNKLKVIVFGSSKRVSDLHLNQAQVEDGLAVRIFNNVDLEKFADEAVRIDKLIDLKSLKVQTFEAKGLKVKQFENQELDEFIETLEKEFQLVGDGSARALRNVKVVGNIDFQSNIFLDTLNDKQQFNEFISLLVLKGEANVDIGGKKVFQQNVRITDHLNSRHINGFPIDRLLYKSLARDEKQTIAGEFFVKTIKTTSLKTAELNNITWNQLIDKRDLHHPVILNLHVGELKLFNLNCKSSSHDVKKMIELAQFPKRNNWNYMTVNQNAEIPVLDSYLGRLMTKAVLKEANEPQVVTGRVQINNAVYIKHLIKPDFTIIAKYTSVDLHQLYLDSVKNFSATTQTVSGKKTFMAPFYIGTLRIGANAFYDTKDVNNVDINNLNRTIPRPTSIIESGKKFANLHVEQLEIRGNISGIPIKSFVFVSDDHVVLPQLKVHQLETNSFSTFSLNTFSLQAFLDNRMRKFEGEQQEVFGVVTFESLDIKKDTIMVAINGVSLEDAVYGQSDHLQDIIGQKIVTGNIQLIGPSVINIINYNDFRDFIRKSVASHQDVVFDSLEIPAVELKNGLMVKHSINAHHVEDLLSSDSHLPKLNDLILLMKQVQSQIKELNKLKAAKSRRLLYVDYDPEIHISYDASHNMQSRCADNIIEPHRHNTIIVREKRDSEMQADVPSMKIKVKPSFQCSYSELTSKTLDIWWSYKDDAVNTYTRNFSFDSDISDVKFLETKKGVVLMVLALQNTTSNTSHLGILHLDKDSHDWFENQRNIVDLNLYTRSTIVETHDHQFLVVSTFNEEKSIHGDYVLILRLDPTTGKFVESKKLAGNKFDIVLSVTVPEKELATKAKTFLLLSREKSYTLVIYELNDSHEFIFQRKIPFDGAIVEVVVLYINNDSPFFIVSLQTGDFCLFEWRGIESWKTRQCGHFTRINHIKSYEYLRRQHLFLTSTLNAGTALTVYRQGDAY